MPRTSGVDMWRDTALRYAGYANEVGEAFRPLIAPLWVRASYGVSLAYVGGDALDKGCKAWQQARDMGAPGVPAMAATAVDVVSWQTAASVVIPGFTINRLVALSRAVLAFAGHKPGLAPTAVGLGAIPLIVKPIDEATEFAFEEYLRPAALQVQHVWARCLKFVPEPE